MERNENKLFVCPRCLTAIESHEGEQITRCYQPEEDNDDTCDWCKESGFELLYVILDAAT